MSNVGKGGVDGHPIANSIGRFNSDAYPRFQTKQVENQDGTITTSTTGGDTGDSHYVKMNTKLDTKMNFIHELFHTFGFSHPDGGGKKKGIMDYDYKKINQNDINELGNGAFLPKIKKEDEKKKTD